MAGDPKILRVGFQSPPRTYDPTMAYDVESGFVLRQVFEAPFGSGYGMAKLEPRIFAQPLQPLASGHLHFRAELRQDLVFSDGIPLTLDLAASCLQQAPGMRELAEVRVEAGGLVFTLKRPNPRFDLPLSHPQCSIYRRSGSALLGTGPYAIAPDSTSSVIRLVRNQHFRRRPAIDEVQIRIYPPEPGGEATALRAALTAGEVDLSPALGRQDIDAVKGVRKSFLPGISTAMLFLRCDRPRLKDARLRRAIARSVDRHELARACYANPRDFVATSLTPHYLAQADDALTFDLAAARALLAQPGVVVPKSLTLLTTWAPRPYLPNPQLVAQLLVEQLGRLDIQVEVHQPLSLAHYLEADLAGDYDLSLGGWVADTLDPCDFLDSVLDSKRIPNDDNLATACNEAHLRSAEMDLALARYREERLGLESILEIMNREAPVVPLMYGPASLVSAYRVANLRPTPLWYVPIEELDLAD